MARRKKSATRQTIERDPENPVSHLDSGYEGDSTSDDFSIPAVGIEDADVALFQLFNRDIGFTNRSINSANKQVAIKKPFVIFATGERFALIKRLNPPREKGGALMLPAISIRRTGFSQTSDDITGRGINQFTGVLAIKRRLDETDRDYQNLLNKLAFKNLGPDSSTRKDRGENGKDPETLQGGLLAPKLGNNMWEIITVPQPQFFTTTYEVVFWTNYTQHMNYLIETYISSFLPQFRGHKLVTDKGYWFLSHTDDTFSSQENFEDFNDETRVVRYSFNVTVKGYLFATNHETNKVPVRRWVSSPVLTFESLPADNLISKEQIARTKNLQDESLFALSDIERDPDTSQTPTGNQRFVTNKKVVDPRTGKTTNKTVSILESNQKKGETVFYASDMTTLKDFIRNLGD